MDLVFSIVGVAILVFIAGVVIFFGWVAVAIIRGLFALLFGRSSGPDVRQVGSSTGTVCYCVRPHCNAENPAHAQFCRRCGSQLRAASQTGVRIVA